MSRLRPLPRVLAAMAGLTVAVGLVVLAQDATNPAHHAAAGAKAKGGSLRVRSGNGGSTTSTDGTGDLSGGGGASGSGGSGSSGGRRRYVTLSSPTTLAALANGGVTSSKVATCPVGQTCVKVNGFAGLGPERFVAQGFIHGVDNSTNPVLVAALSPRSWLLADNGGDAVQARVTGATVTYLLEEAWSNFSSGTNRGVPIPPWDDLSTFSTWVRQEVTTVEASGQHVDYWEVLNEPDGYFYSHRPTPDQAWSAFQTGVDAVRQADPSAKVVGPALSAFNDQQQPVTLDMATFLQDVVNAHMRLDAVAWHEVGSLANAADASTDPESVVFHAGLMRNLLRRYPVGNPAIFINEYEAVSEHLIPGWEVGWMGALDASGVDEANRSCWHQPDINGKVVAECNEGGLDGLLVPGSGIPEAIYHVHRAYAQMAGTRVATSSTDPNITAIAARDDGARVLRVLVGRHQSCTPLIRVDCHQPAAATPPPANVSVAIAVPWSGGNYQVAVQLIPNVTGPVTNPSPVVSTSVAGAGAVSVPIPAFADGDAYVVTVTAV